jgi:glucose/mannose-6-phosphate isomerase
LERLGLVEDVGPALEETIELLERQSQHYGPGSPLAANQAKQLALRLLGKLAVIYGSEGVTGLAAFRFRCQINENSKCPAKWNMLPELDHNEITGWQELGEVSRQFRLIFFRDSAEHSQVKKRIEITRDLIKNQFEGQEECWASGVSKMARLFSLIYLGDFSSVYLALLYGLDPSPVERIELLKKRLVS